MIAWIGSPLGLGIYLLVIAAAWVALSAVFSLVWVLLHRVGWHGPYVPGQAYADDFARHLSGSALPSRTPSAPGAEPDMTIVYSVPSGPRGITSRTTPNDAPARRSRGDEIRHLHSVH